MSLLTILADQSAFAAAPGTIESPGPLESIATSPDLNCDVRYAGDEAPEFYAGIACGTFVAVNSTLYGPENVPAGGGATPRTAFTPVSQEGPTGAGTAADPWMVTTTVDLGESGVRLTQTDTYVAGQQSYVTRVRLVNSADSDVPVIVYRAGDCYVEDSDYGYGDASEGTVACVAESGRVAKWIPVTGGSAYMQASYHEVWSAIGSRQMFPNTTRGDEYLDNGAGLSWQVDVQAGDDAEIAHLTAFSEDATTAGDADGDGLLDEWETEGLDVDGDGVPEVDLPAMGATPDHKDLFVEVDWMSDPRSCVLWWCWGGRDFAPQPDAIQDAVASFAAAPVPNPDGTTGIRLHVDAGEDYVMNPENGALWGARSRANAVGHQGSLGESGPNGYDWTQFNELKSDNFEVARADVFRYTIFADRYADSGSSGIAQISDSVWEGDSFLVTDGGFGETGFSRRQESGTFMHEFGHTLGLRHGGVDHVQYKPNYQSIMSYFWQLGGRPLDFSRQTLPIVDEGALLEGEGLAGATGAYSWFCPDGTRETSTNAGTTDWDCDGEVDEDLLGVDVNDDGEEHVLAGFDDWANLVYDGGAVGAFGVHDLNDQNPPLQFSPLQEASYEDLLDRDLVGAPGDGSVAVVGPYVLLPGVADQSLQVRVSNVGSSTADYAVGLMGVPGVEPEMQVLAVPGHGTSIADIPVDGSALVPGTYEIDVTLRGPGGGATLSSASAQVLVPDLADADVRAQLRQIRQTLLSPQPGLDEALRHQALDALTASMLAHATVAVTAGDAQSAVEGNTFDSALEVSVVGEDGEAIGGAPVTFTVTDGDAHFDGAARVVVQTDAGGRAVAPPPTAGAPGPVTVVAQAGSASVTFGLLVTSEETRPAGIDVHLDGPTSAARGEQFTMSVVVSNTGGVTAEDVMTTVWIPRGAAVVPPRGTDTQGARYTVTAPQLAPGTSVSYIFLVTKGSSGTLPVKAAVVAEAGDLLVEDWHVLHIAT